MNQPRATPPVAPLFASILFLSCVPTAPHVAVDLHGSTSHVAWKVIPLREDGARTGNLLPDPGFERSLSDFLPPAAPSWISHTETQPVAGRGSLLVYLHRTQPRTEWTERLHQTNLRGAARLVVQAEARAAAACGGGLQLCAEATTRAGTELRQCMPLRGLHLARRGPVSVGLDLPADQQLQLVGMAVEYARGRACIHRLDNVSAVLEGPVLRQRDADRPTNVAVPEAVRGGLNAPVGEIRPPLASAVPMHPNSFFYRDISRAAKSPASDRIIAWMAKPGRSFDPGGRLQLDLSLELLTAGADAPWRTFDKTEDFYPIPCDDAAVPVPRRGSVEANPSYRCSDNGDCHLIVFHRPSRLLYELWRAHIPNGRFDGPGFRGGCLAIWDSTRDYGMTGRGLDCTSADAAGFPIAPMTFTAEEVASGEIRHALRLILPNRNIRRLTYVPPATHTTFATSGPDEAPPYGALFRLKADFDMGRVRSRGGRVVARALQVYGAYVADGGAIAITGASDRFSSVKWCDRRRFRNCGEDPQRVLHEFDLIDTRITDFEVVYTGPNIAYRGDCQRLSPTPRPRASGRPTTRADTR